MAELTDALDLKWGQPVRGGAEALYEIDDYSGPDDTWVEGEIVFWQYKFDLADDDLGDWNLAGNVVVGQTELNYQVDHDGDIHVWGEKVDLEDVIPVDVTFEANNGAAGGVITFREYVVPESGINIASFQMALANYAEVISSGGGGGYIGWWPNPAIYGAAVSCEGRTGTPD